MPNPGKPIALKLMTGSRRVPSAAGTVVLPALERVPSAPDWLPNSYARAEWKRLATLLVANRLLTEGSLSVLGHACALYGAITRSWSAGHEPRAATLGIYRQIVNDFGLTPASAARAGAARGDASSANRFLRHGRRPSQEA